MAGRETWGREMVMVVGRGMLRVARAIGVANAVKAVRSGVKGCVAMAVAVREAAQASVTAADTREGKVLAAVVEAMAQVMVAVAAAAEQMATVT